MSESACGGANTGSGASDKGVTCPECGKQCKSEHGLKIHTAQAHDGHNKLRDPDWLWQKRWEEGLEQRDIAELSDVSHNAVGYQLRKHGISGGIHPYIDDPEILHDLYIRRDMSIKELCDEFDVDKSTVAERCEEFGFNKDIHRTNVWGLRWAIPFIREKYIEEKWTITEISEELNVTMSPVLNIMDRYDIQRRGRSWYSGEKSKQYQGGKRSAIYKGNWSEQRNKARERDGYKCQLCGKPESDMQRQLSVHHKKPYKTFDDPKEANKLENLLSLCASCHPKVERWPVQPHR